MAPVPDFPDVPQDTGHFVITINRDFGSLGRPIARRLAELLGVEFYDRDIVEATAKKLHKPISVISDAEEQKASG
ncbi:AAA family ATPase, partial [Selenomonas sp.]